MHSLQSLDIGKNVLQGEAADTAGASMTSTDDSRLHLFHIMLTCATLCSAACHRLPLALYCTEGALPCSSNSQVSNPVFALQGHCQWSTGTLQNFTA